MLLGEDDLESIISKALDAGASYAEARVHRIKCRSFLVKNAALVGAKESVSYGVAIRVIADGALAFSSATLPASKDEIYKVVLNAVSKAKNMAWSVRRKVEFSRDRLGRASYRVKEKKNMDSESDDEKIKLLRETCSLVKSIVKTAKVPVVSVEYGEEVEEKLYMNSDGALITSVTPRIILEYTLTLEGDGESLNRVYTYTGTGGLELIREWRIPESICDEALRLEKIVLKSKAPPRGKLDVVFGSEVVGLVVHESCGHPCEADRILGREAAQAGESFIPKRLGVGDKIGGAEATVIDDPTIPGSAGFYLYDDEGVPARPKYLYLKGVINELLHNRWTARVYGVSSNGSARAADYKSEPIVRMSNTYLEPGDYSFSELLEDIKLGVYVKSYMEWNIDDERWSQRYVGLEAYAIVDGEIAYPVKNPVIEFTTPEFYSKLDARTKNLEFHAGLCGKGEPAQGIPVWLGGPEARVRGLLVR